MMQAPTKTANIPKITPARISIGSDAAAGGGTGVVGADVGEPVTGDAVGLSVVGLSVGDWVGEYVGETVEGDKVVGPCVEGDAVGVTVVISSIRRMAGIGLTCVTYSTGVGVKGS